MKEKVILLIISVITMHCMLAHAFTVSYDQVTIGLKGGATQDTSIKIKDDKMRMEVKLPLGKAITIVNGDTAYQYMTWEKKAYKTMTRGLTNISNLSDYSGYLSTLGAKVVGSENVGNYDCDIYEFVDPGSKVNAKAWVWRAKNFPVKYELALPSGKVMTVMKNVVINASIDDAEFTLPKGVEVIDMLTMKNDNQNSLLKNKNANKGAK